MLDRRLSPTELEGVFILLEAADVPIFPNVRDHSQDSNTVYTYLCNALTAVDLATERYRSSKNVCIISYDELVKHLVDYVKNNKYEC